MGDLSRKPPLKSAVTNADAHAKRKFEVYGGKHSNEPPLERVPKQAKVTLQHMDLDLLRNGNWAPKMNLMTNFYLYS
jgi:hypothetical protein